MAKEQFQRTKPHVNVARQKLLQAGMSMSGIDQVLNGRPVLQLADCEIVSRIVLQAVGQTHAAGSMLLPRLGWE